MEEFFTAIEKHEDTAVSVAVFILLLVIFLKPNKKS